MAKKFDPYRKWLGIPPQELPPNHYRLLGIGLFESDPDVISNAADRQMAHVRTFQSGNYSKVSQRLLNELSTARVCLLDATQRKPYDEHLQAKLAAAAPPPPASAPPPPPSAVPAAPVAQAVPVVPAVTAGQPQFGIQRKTPGGTAYRSRRKKSSWQVSVVILVMVVVLLGLLALALNDSAEETPAKKPVKQRQPSVTVSPADFPASSPRRRRPKRDRDRGRRPSSDPGSSGTGTVQTVAKEGSDPPGEIRAFSGNTAPVNDAIFSPDGLFILSGSEDKSLRLLDVEGGYELRRFEGSTAPVSAVAISADGQHVAAASGQLDPSIPAVVRVWETAGGQETTRIDTSSVKFVHAVKFSVDGKQIFLAGSSLAGNDNTIRLIDLASGEEVRSFSGHTGPVRSVAISADGQRVLSGSDDGTIRVWNRFSGDQMRSLTAHEGPVNAVAFQPGTKFGLSGGADKTVRLWNLKSGRQVCEMSGHTGPVNSVDCTPDGSRALSGSDDGTIRLWQLPDGNQLVQFDAHPGGVRSASFSPGGYRGVSAGADKLVRLWGLPADLSPPSDDPAAQQPGDGQSPDEMPQPTRLAIPDAAAQQQAEDLIKTDIFKADFEAATKPSTKTALIKKLLDKGLATEDDATSAYVLLRLARDMAAESGDTGTAMTATDDMIGRFDVNGPEMKADLLDTASKLTLSASARKLLVEKMLSVLDEAREADDYPTAERLALLARMTASKARDGALTKRVAARAQQLQALKQSYESVARARATIEKQPDDAQANEVLGQHICFTKGDWDRGLPNLAKSADATLNALAKIDIAGPEEPDKQLALADQWWALAEKQTDAARQRRIKSRAAMWYALAEPNLQGLPKTKARDRIAEIGTASTDTASTDTASTDTAAGPAAPVALPKVDGLKCREEPAKSALLAALGGTQSSEAAVELALEWLAAHQNTDGSWSFDHDGPRCKGRCANPGDEKGAPNAATALAVLPFLGAGEGPRSGKHRKNVFTAVQFLKKQMVSLSPTVGTLFEPKVHQIPSHALGTIALCEASFADHDRTTRIAAQAAVNFIVATQGNDGGWAWKPKLRKTDPDSPSGISATCWNLMALESARLAKLTIPPKTTKAVTGFLDSLRSADGKGYSRELNLSPDPQSTSAALYCRMLLGSPRDNSQLTEFVQTLGARGPSGKDRLSSEYRNTAVLMNFGGPAWQKWNPAMRDSLISTQSHADHESGSWFMPGSGMTRHGGRLYCTAMAALILESYYLYPTER